jgi:hypothetical protein
MIVYGGMADAVMSDANRTGGIFDPETNEWEWVNMVLPPVLIGEAVSILDGGGSPAVWSGTEMLLWGGAGMGGIYFPGLRYYPGGETKGRFDSTSDHWKVMTCREGGPAPSGFVVGNSILWTGDTGEPKTRFRMLVWGGYYFGAKAVDPGYINRGGLYSNVSTAGVGSVPVPGIPTPFRHLFPIRSMLHSLASPNAMAFMEKQRIFNISVRGDGKVTLRRSL